MNTKIVYTQCLESNESDYKIFFLYGNRKNVLHPGYFLESFYVQIFTSPFTQEYHGCCSFSVILLCNKTHVWHRIKSV